MLAIINKPLAGNVGTLVRNYVCYWRLWLKRNKVWKKIRQSKLPVLIAGVENVKNKSKTWIDEPYVKKIC